MTALLQTMHDPADLRRLAPHQLPVLAREIRAFLVVKVCATGGHPGPNLGVVELTIALPRVHKILTGRRTGFDALR